MIQAGVKEAGRGCCVAPSPPLGLPWQGPEITSLAHMLLSWAIIDCCHGGEGGCNDSLMLASKRAGGRRSDGVHVTETCRMRFAPLLAFWRVGGGHVTHCII